MADTHKGQEMSAEERANITQGRHSKIIDQIRQAEAAAHKEGRIDGRKEALEKATKATCKKCRELGLSKYDDRLKTWVHHGYTADRCDAVFIRALAESTEP